MAHGPIPAIPALAQYVADTISRRGAEAARPILQGAADDWRRAACPALADAIEAMLPNIGPDGPDTLSVGLVRLAPEEHGGVQGVEECWTVRVIPPAPEDANFDAQENHEDDQDATNDKIAETLGCMRREGDWWFGETAPNGATLAVWITYA